LGSIGPPRGCEGCMEEKTSLFIASISQAAIGVTLAAPRSRARCYFFITW
jgi:hypothetical protein